MSLFLISLYFILTLFISIFLVVYIWTNGKSSYMRYLGTLSFLIAVYIVGYMLELHSKTLEMAIIWNAFQYLSIPMISTVWLIVVLLYTGVIKKTRSKRIHSLLLIPVITYILRFSNASHHLYYTFYEFEIFENFGLLTFGRGPWYYVQYIYSLIQLVTIVFIFFYFAYKDEKKRRRFINLGLISVLNFSNMFLMIIDPIGLGLDYSAILLPIPIVLFFYLIGGEDYFEIGSLARNSLFINNNSAMIILNNQNMIVDYNKKAEMFFGYHDLDLTEMYISDYQNQNIEIYSLLASQEKKLYHKKVNNKDVWWEVSTNAIYNNHNKKSGIVKTIADVTENQITQKRLEKFASTDDLSKLYNRRAFSTAAEDLINKASDKEKFFTLVLFDIDHFKNVNDKFGHHQGDVVIRKISDLAKNSFRKGDMISRIGGEEFTVLMDGATSKIAFKRAEAFRKKVADHHFIENDYEYKITLSIGVASYRPGINLNGLLKLSDKALYKAKEERNKTVIYDESI